MTNTLGNIKGQLILDVRQAINSYTAARQAHISTTTALHTGAGAMMAASTAIAVPAAAMVAGFVSAIEAASEFERKLDYFTAVSGATQAEYNAIREEALRLGADTIYSADQIAESFVELGKSGVEAADIINGIGEGVANLGAAADMPLDQAANIMMSAVATFRLGADEAVWVADQLAGAANASIIDVEDLGVSLKYVGGVASSLGLEFDEVNTALAILGENGIKGSTAGTSLRQILLGLTGTTAAARGELADLGIIMEDGTNQFFNADGSAKSLSETMQILADATAHMTDEQRISSLQTIFATRALPSLVALTREGAAGFDEMSAAISRTTAMDVASTRLDNLSGDLEILRGNLETLMIETGSGFQSFARSLIQGITGILQGFMDLDPGVQQTIITVAAIAAGLMLLIAVFGLMAGSLMNIMALSIQVRDSFLLLRLGIGAFTTAMGMQAGVMGALRAGLAAMTGVTVAQTAATGAATGAQTGLNVAMLANPIGIIIGLVVALVAALIWFFTSTEIGQQAWAHFMGFLQEAWTNIVSFATTIWAHLSEFFVQLWANIVNVFNGAVAGVTAAITWIMNIPTMIADGWNMLLTWWDGIWMSMVTTIATFIYNALVYLQGLPAQIGAFFAALPGQIGFALGFLLGVIVGWFISIGQWLATNVPIIINNVVTFFAELPGRIGAFFAQLWTAISTWFVTILTNAHNWAASVIEGIISFFVQLPGRIAAFVQQMYNNIRTWLTNAWNTARTIAQNIVTGIINFIQQLPQRIADFFTQVRNNIVNFFTDAYNNAVRIAQNIYNGIRDAINGLPALVSGIFNRVVGAVRDMVGAAFNAVRDFAAGLWEGFQAGLGIHSPSYIERAIWQITGVLDDETQRMAGQVNTIQELGEGINDAGRNMTLGANLDRELAETADALRAVQRMGATLPNSIGVEGRQTLALDEMGNALKNLEQQVNYNIEVNNPKPETASESLPGAIRETVYLVGT